MLEKLTSQGKALVTVSIATVKLLVLGSRLARLFPLPTVPCVALGLMTILPFPSTIPTLPKLPPSFLVHLLLHLTIVLLLLNLQVVLVEASKPSVPDLRSKPNP